MSTENMIVVTLMLIFILFSNAVNLRRDMAILYNRVSLVSLFYCGLISYTTINKKSSPKLDKRDFFIFLRIILQIIFMFKVYTCLNSINPTEYNYFVISFATYIVNLDSSYFFQVTGILLEKFHIHYFIVTYYKYFISFTLTLLFSILFIKDFVKKHLNFFKKVSLDRYMIFTLIIIILIIFFPRILFRNLIITFIFEELTYFSLVLSILWTLPFISYIINILRKLIIGEKIKKEDLSILNDFVVNSINIYTICFILIYVYVSLKYSGYILSILLHIYNYISYSSSSICYINGSGSLSIDMPRVFFGENMEMVERDWITEPEKKTKNWSFKTGLSNIIKGQFFMVNPFGKTELSVRNNCLPMRQLFKLTDDITNKPLLETFNVAHNDKFNSAHIVIDKINKKKTLIIAAKGTTSEDKIVRIKDWIQYPIEDMGYWFNVFDNHAVRFYNFDRTSLTDMLLLLEPEAVKYLTKNKYYPHTESASYKNNNLTHFHKLGYGPYLPKPSNFEDIFGSSYRKYLLSRIQSLDSIKNSLPEMNNWQETVFCNKNLAGYFFEKPNGGEGNFIITHENSLESSYIKCIMDDKYFTKALSDLNYKFGFPINHRLTRKVITYSPIIPIDPQFSKVSAHTIHNNIYGSNYYTRINFPYEKFIFYPITVSYQHISQKFITILKQVIGCIDTNIFSRETNNNWYKDNINSNEKLILQKSFKKEMQDILLEDILSTYKYYHIPSYDQTSDIGSIFVYKSYSLVIDNSYLLVCTSKKPLFAELNWLLGDKQVIVPTKIDTDLKRMVNEFLQYKSNLFQVENTCQHNNIKINILFLDNFCVEFVITESECKQFCERFHEVFLPSIEYIVWKDEDGNNKNILNLLEIQGPQILFNYINKFIK